MASPDHVSVFKEGKAVWNAWRDANPTIKPDLTNADLKQSNMVGAVLSGTDFRHADLSDSDLSFALFSPILISAKSVDLPVGYGITDTEWSMVAGDAARIEQAELAGANLSRAKLIKASLDDVDLTGCILAGADLGDASLYDAILVGADLSGARLTQTKLERSKLCNATLIDASMFGAMLSEADLKGANLMGAKLIGAYLIRTQLSNADLTNCSVYGASVWDVKLEGTVQSNLVITSPDEPEITTDNLELAQFLYLLLRNESIRNVIDTITSKVVLILGRFTPERKATLDALRNALRRRNYLPVLFDFEKPRNRDFTETVSTLARLAKFVIADLTNPASIPQELTALVYSDLFSVPIRAVLLGGAKEWAMFVGLARRPQVIAPFYYVSDAMLLDNLDTNVIAPAEEKARQLMSRS